MKAPSEIWKKQPVNLGKYEDA
jgi:hypothetical protein